MYLENYKTSKKEIEEYTINGSRYHVHGRINIIKTSILPKAIYRFNAIFIKIPMAFLTEVGQTILKFVWNHERPWIAIAILRKKNRVGCIMLLDTELCYNAIVVKTTWYRHENRHKDQCKWIESPEINSCYRVNLWQRRQIYNEVKTVSSINGVRQSGQIHAKNDYHLLMPYARINSKWIKDLNVRPKTIKLLEKK